MSKIKTKQKPVTDSKSQYLGKQILSLMDEYSRYNQIFIVEEETELRKKKKETSGLDKISRGQTVY
jgi:lysyl-tRNA synthetase class I